MPDIPKNMIPMLKNAANALTGIARAAEESSQTSGEEAELRKELAEFEACEGAKGVFSARSALGQRFVREIKRKPQLWQKYQQATDNKARDLCKLDWVNDKNNPQREDPLLHRNLQTS